MRWPWTRRCCAPSPTWGWPAGCCSPGPTSGSRRPGTNRGSGPWVLAQLTTSRALILPTTGERLPAETFDIGELAVGPWAPGSAGSDSRNVVEFEKGTVTLRLPWSLLGLADPSSRQALVPGQLGQPAGTVPVEGIGIALAADGTRLELGTFTWSGWNSVTASERVKDGVQAWVDALAAVSR